MANVKSLVSLPTGALICSLFEPLDGIVELFYSLPLIGIGLTPLLVLRLVFLLHRSRSQVMFYDDTDCIIQAVRLVGAGVEEQ